MTRSQRSLTQSGPLSIVTRARRLNVLIQPNLKFLYELQGWEGASDRSTHSSRRSGLTILIPSDTAVEISREKAEAECRLDPINIDSSSGSPNKTDVGGRPRAHGRKATSWPIMAREIVSPQSTDFVRLT